MTDAVSPKKFRFISYHFDKKTSVAEFKYAFDESRQFCETVNFPSSTRGYSEQALDSALFYCFIVLGTSYYKLFPGAEFSLEVGGMTRQQAEFFSGLYSGGLSQFVYENNLDPSVISEFSLSEDATASSAVNGGDETYLMQSGGKDSLLAASLMSQNDSDFIAWHMSSTGEHPEVIDDIGAKEVVDVQRNLDISAIRSAMAGGGLNGHVPFSAITAGLALVSAVLGGGRYIIAAMEASSDEANTMIGDYAVNHMYSKTYQFEQDLQRYIHVNIARDIDYLSLIRAFTDLRVAELFAQNSWEKYKNKFASCNIANYKQGEDKGQLSWCGDCSKCANSFLLFSAFINYDALVSIFDQQNLFEKQSLRDDFLALLGLEGVKPFECVGTVDELRQAYGLAMNRDARYRIEGVGQLEYSGDYRDIHPHQALITRFIDDKLVQLQQEL